MVAISMTIIMPKGVGYIKQYLILKYAMSSLPVLQIKCIYSMF